MSEEPGERLQKIYNHSKLKPPYTKLSLVRRYWIYQWERLPLIPLILMGLAICAAAMKANDVFSWTRLIAGTSLVTAYLLQIRFADEPKDYEHDNKFYPTRPVQRGVITLRELLRLRNLMIGVFFATALALRSWPIFLLTCLQQVYSLLTRKEFFMREWLRKHFLTYMFSHYFQLFILSWLVMTVLQIPPGQKFTYFGLALLLIGVVEISRKMQEADNDKAGDTYSATLGTTKAALLFVGLILVLAAYVAEILLSANAAALGFVAVGVIFAMFAALRYTKIPNKPNTKLLQGSGIIYFFLCSIAVLTGA